MLVVMALPMMVACGGDDDGGSGGSVKSKLVGIWKTSMSSSNWKVIELKSDGTLVYNMWVDKDGEIWAYSSLGRSAYWSYNEQEQTISMYSESGYYAYTYKVNMSEEGKAWAGYKLNSSGSSTTVSFVRLEGTVHVSTEY